MTDQALNPEYGNSNKKKHDDISLKLNVLDSQLFVSDLKVKSLNSGKYHMEFFYLKIKLILFVNNLGKETLRPCPLVFSFLVLKID